MEGGLYQNKVNLSLMFTQRLGHQAHNCKVAYLFFSLSFTQFSKKL